MAKHKPQEPTQDAPAGVEPRTADETPTVIRHPCVGVDHVVAADLQPGGSGWVDAAALVATPEGLAIDAGAAVTLFRPEGEGVRIERELTGFAIDRSQAPDHEPATHAGGPVIPARDATTKPQPEPAPTPAGN